MSKDRKIINDGVTSRNLQKALVDLEKAQGSTTSRNLEKGLAGKGGQPTKDQSGGGGQQQDGKKK